MLNKETERTNNAIDFVTCYGEMSAAYNERLMEFDVEEVLEKVWNDEYIDLKKEDLPEVLDIFNEEFVVPENGYRYLEVKSIRKWIGEKFYA